MLLSKLFFKTVKEEPKEADSVSHKLLLRSGMIYQTASGVYSYLPLGYKVLKKLIHIIESELDAIGCNEVSLPILSPSELWNESGRWEKAGPEMFKVKDRKEREYALSPTSEEAITDIVRKNIKSYKELPITLYQIGTKFRDEIRPRFGLMRSREFLMKDGYSFSADSKSSEQIYSDMLKAYTSIFKRMSLNFRVCEADNGTIGGDASHEFVVTTDAGEASIAYCDSCSYSANVEKAVSYISRNETVEPLETLKKVATVSVTDINAVSKFLSVKLEKCIKAVVYKADDRYVMALIRGDLDINECKLAIELKANELRLATNEELLALGLKKGFIGPVIEKKQNLEIAADQSLENCFNMVAGGNAKDCHLMNVNLNRDFNPDRWFEIAMVKKTDLCAKCKKGSLNIIKGIEVGHVFNLGSRYSKAMGCSYIDENGKKREMEMGCYGIGVSRLMAAIIEQNNDEDGIKWPLAVAPFVVNVIPSNVNDEGIFNRAYEIYNRMKDEGIDVALDDRNNSAGSKFKDSDLIGFCIKVIVGKHLSDGIVEIISRKDESVFKVRIAEVLDTVKSIINSELS